MRRRWARLTAVAFSLVVLTGCSVVVVGQATPARPPVTDVAAGETGITGATDEPVDVLARNALADLEVFWGKRLPEDFGIAFEPLAGGYFSVDPGDADPAAYPRGIGCGAVARDVEDNAFYCVARDAPNSDSISYDRTFLADLGAEYGRFIPALVMAHEFAHAVQARVGAPPVSIAVETQADCLAGTWTRWVADGGAEHSVLRTPELDELLRGYLLLRDPVGTNPGEQQAHGSYFDRVAAFQEGFDSGTAACRDNFGPDRVFTQEPFASDEDVARGGNAPYGELLDIIDTSLPAAWEQAVTDFEAPTIASFDGDAPGCAPDAGLDLVYCADENLVAFDRTDLAAPAYDELGDFAVATAVALPYGLAVRDQLGLSTDGEEALRSAVCLSGWYAAQVFAGRAGGTSVSPGDVDESVQFLLAFGGEPSVVPDADLTGFQLVDFFRNGFVQGLDACGLDA
ncbi:neutral zinc metallopeptidase [Blastococcus goldschmidtiae]|uniref:Neutral zinc metallopeptidase n=1 Tax=Blastococcus goldschmidtiae TaxID=3075546 RepID=A0ABU2KE37_9ACTN|nr:neutral zinc metallopeptidase [Blastococcus sp. DSM 46792]MDT0278451.1 neutral zinc metallopeptidase [Blastococcus sp. DSM 46792]